VPAYGGLSANPDPYAPNFEPYAAQPAQQRPAPPSYQPQAPQQTYQPQLAHGYSQQAYGAPDPRLQPQQQWQPQPAAARGFEPGNYLQQPAPVQQNTPYRGPDPRHHEVEPSLSDWNGPQHQNGQGYEFGEPNSMHNDMGFAQAAGGELEQSYAEDDGQDYDFEEPGRGRRPLMIAAALAGAIVIGAGFSYGYKSILGNGASGNPPMVKSAVEPSKTKPADAGGKQFAHTDSKIMGRLGDGNAPEGEASQSGDVDANGTRKVSTLVVGRDGSIQPPPAAAADAPTGTAPVTAPTADAGVPGMMIVDALGGNKSRTAAVMVPTGGAAATQAAPQQVATASAAPQKLVVTPPPAAKALPDATGSIDQQPAAPAPKKTIAKKLAAAAPVTTDDASAPAAAAPVTSGGTNGYVAVLASVPKSASSRIDALKRFADMQQKYGNVLGGKTPDVAEANLGAKGQYHRLVVGPPGSREQASALCSQLKSQGYSDCWVTSY
jgi:hypothetical protein